MKLQIDEITTFEGLIALKNEWDALLQSSAANTVFLTHEWIVNWWKCFGKDKQLLILIVKKDGEIAGIAPLMIIDVSFLGLKRKQVQFIGTDLSDYADFIVARDHASILHLIFSHLLENEHRWDEINLSEVPGHSPSFFALKDSLGKLTDRHIVVFGNECVSLSIAEADPPELSSLLKKKDLRRHIKHLQGLGTLECKKIRELPEATQALAVLFLQHRRIWAQRNDPSMFEDQQYREFFQNLTDALLPKKQVDLWVLSLDRKPIAIQFGFNYNGSYITYCQSQDMEFSKQSVGTIMYKLFIEQYLQEGLALVDFSRGKENYKYRFANKTSANFSIIINKNIISHLLSKINYASREIAIKNKWLHTSITRLKKFAFKTKLT